MTLWPFFLHKEGCEEERVDNTISDWHGILWRISKTPKNKDMHTSAIQHYCWQSLLFDSLYHHDLSLQIWQQLHEIDLYPGDWPSSLNFPFAPKQWTEESGATSTHGSVTSADNQKHVALGSDVISERKRGKNPGKKTDTGNNNGDGSSTYIAQEME